MQADPTRGLCWAIHAGFVGYVSRLWDGEISLGGGAGVTALGEFHFPAGPEPGRFEGDVRFAGHGGLLALHLAEPRLEADAAGEWLALADLIGGTRLRVARLCRVADGGVDRWDAWLLPEAVELFGEAYPEGTELAAVQVALGTATVTPLTYKD